MLEYARSVDKIRMYEAYYNLVHTGKNLTEHFFAHVWTLCELGI